MKTTYLRKVGKQEAWDNFVEAMKVIIKAPKQKKRKSKAKPKKTKKKGGK